MARITIEDCLKLGYNKFMLVHLAAKRVIQLRKGKEPLATSENREVVTALREIAADKVRMRTGNGLPEAYLEIESETPAVGHLEMESEAPAEADSERESETPENEVNMQPDDNKDTSDTT